MKFSKEIKVGLFAIFTITTLYLGFNYLKGIDFFSTTKKYYVIYKNVNGLSVSNPVRMNGFTVGRVSSIKMVQGVETKILVELDLNGDIVLGDSTVALLASEVLGGRFIALEGDDYTHPIEKGDTIQGRLDTGIEDILKEAGNLETTINKINLTLDNFAGSSKSLTSLFTKLDKTPDRLNSTLLDVKKLIKGLDRRTDTLSTGLAHTIDSLNTAISDVKKLVGKFNNLELNKTLKQVDDALGKLSETLTKVSNEHGTLGKLMNNDSLYNNLNTMILNLDTLVNHLDENPKHFLGPLGQSKKRIEKDRRKEAEKSEK